MVAIQTLAASGAHAAGPEGAALPGPADPNRVPQRLETPATPESSEPTFEMPPKEQAPPPDQAKAVHFTLKQLTLKDAAPFDADSLKPLYAGSIGKQITLADLYDIRDALTAEIRRRGYQLSQVVIPAQRIENGQVTLQAIAGFVSEVRFEGGPEGWAEKLKPYGDKIMASKPTMIADLQRYVLLMNELPGVQVKTVLKPADGVPGGVILVVTLTPHTWEASSTFDNRGSKSIGPVQIDTTGAYNFLRDRLEARTLVTSDPHQLKLLSGTWSHTVDEEGTVLVVNGSASLSHPGGSTQDLEIANHYSSFEFSATHPLIRTESETLKLTGSFSMVNSRTKDIVGLLSDDRVRPLTLGISYDRADDWGGHNIGSFTLTKGFNILNAVPQSSSTLSRSDGRPSFTKYAISGERDQDLFGPFTAALTIDGQWSPYRLLSSEQYGIGGAQYGAAYEPSEITGDTGLAAKFEFRYTPEWAVVAPLKYVQFFTSIDGGKVWSHPALGATGGGAVDSLSSLAWGARAGVTDHLDSIITLAKPLTRATSATDSRDLRLFLSLSGHY